MILLDCSSIPDVRRRLAQSDPRLAAPAARLRSEADEALTQGPWSVVDKPQVPPSGDKHDYMSVGIYWWPNPETPGGLPYVRRDGESNPLYYQTDGGRLQKLRPALETLSLAYSLFGDERYAVHAVRLIRTWFLDAATRMNPHMRYAQAIPGICDGRAIGMVDGTQGFSGLPACVVLLRPSQAWTEADEAGLQAWFNQYLDWFIDSDFGHEEIRHPNNHGTWYDLLAVSVALFTRREPLARRVLTAVPGRRIAMQIETDGRQPAELRRTRAFTYSVVNLLGLFHLAQLGETLGYDLWRYETADGRGIRSALRWLADYADPRTPWPYPEIAASNQRENLHAMLCLAAVKYDDPSYREIIRALPRSEIEASRFQLTFGPVEREA